MARTRGLNEWGAPAEMTCSVQLRLVRPFFFTPPFYTQAYQAVLLSEYCGRVMDTEKAATPHGGIMHEYMHDHGGACGGLTRA